MNEFNENSHPKRLIDVDQQNARRVFRDENPDQVFHRRATRAYTTDKKRGSRGIFA